jgi:hypothetical protein
VQPSRKRQRSSYASGGGGHGGSEGTGNAGSGGSGGGGSITRHDGSGPGCATKGRRPGSAGDATAYAGVRRCGSDGVGAFGDGGRYQGRLDVRMHGR